MLHKHHIIPKHAGGTDDPSNLIELTVEEHAEAHRLLYEEYGKLGDKLAWKALSGQIGKEEIQLIKSRLGQMHFSGKKQKPETIQKRVEKLRGKKRTPETIKLMSEVMKGKTLSAKDWIITTPHGIEMNVSNLKEFCRNNNLADSAMCLVSKGQRQHHKGFKIRKL
jgi:hypothetical protein